MHRKGSHFPYSVGDRKIQREGGQCGKRRSGSSMSAYVTLHEPAFKTSRKGYSVELSQHGPRSSQAAKLSSDLTSPESRKVILQTAGFIRSDLSAQ